MNGVEAEPAGRVQFITEQVASAILPSQFFRWRTLSHITAVEAAESAAVIMCRLPPLNLGKGGLFRNASYAPPFVDT